MNMEDIVYRNEEKYLITKQEETYLKNLIAAVCKKDINSNQNDGGYWIRSLYFDSLSDRDYNEKILGVSERRKIRLRIYNFDTQTVKLEIKNKIESYSVKETLTISRWDSQELQNGNYDILLKYGSRIANKAYYYLKKEQYRPKKIVDYIREAYMYPVENIRITFDHDIKTGSTLDLFNKNFLLYPVLDRQMCVLEVKYDKFFPVILKEILSSSEMYRCSYSKYGAARMMTD